MRVPRWMVAVLQDRIFTFNGMAQDVVAKQSTKGSLAGLRLEPLAFICHPPTEEENRNGGNNSPFKWQREIRNQTQNREQQPKDLALHGFCWASWY